MAIQKKSEVTMVRNLFLTKSVIGPFNIRLLVFFIQPGKPAQNAFIERLNRTFREDILDDYLFNSISEIQDMAFDWMEMYNSDRPHESLGNLSPHQYALTVSSDA